MKKILIFLVSIFLLLFLVNSSFAKENIASQDAMMSDDATGAAALTPTPTPDYPLPYPGILPDSPLYSIKALRDRIISLLISNPLKKAEFDLLQTDKRLNSGIYLFEKGNVALAETTISKGENYFGEAILQSEEATRQGEKTADLVKRLSRAAWKHQKVIDGLTKKAPKEYKKAFENLSKRVAEAKKKAEKLTSN